MASVRLGRYRIATDAVLVAVLVGLVALQCSAPEPPDAALERMQIQQAKLALAYRRQRLVTESVTVVNQANETTVRSTTMLLRRTTDRLAARLAFTDSVISDTSVSTDMLRLALRESVEQVRTYAAQVTQYTVSVDSMMLAWDGERAAYRVSLALADSVMAADAQTIAHLTERHTCRILTVRCPTRTTSFVGGMLLTLTLVVL